MVSISMSVGRDAAIPMVDPTPGPSTLTPPGGGAEREGGAAFCCEKVSFTGENGVPEGLVVHGLHRNNIILNFR